MNIDLVSGGLFSLTRYDGWEPIGERLGKGGQGTVYRARSPEWVKQREEVTIRITHLLHKVSAVGPEISVSELAQKVVEIGSPDPLEHLGAVKQFAIPSDDKHEEAEVVGRLISEVQALQKVKHPAVLKLLHSNIDKRFIVTEYHPRGTLDKNLNRYQGNALAALQAFRTLVEGVIEIHKRDAIHRDIKPENIFLAASENLVLGDFGIVFLQEGGERLTTTYERVGSHFWMPPWAYDNARLNFNLLKPTLDIYPLGKVLWSMISGRNGFPFWELDRDENNLEKIFPNDPMMPRVNRLLSKCIVREESACIPVAGGLLNEVDRLIELARSVAQKPEDGGPWPCRMCGHGQYSETKFVMSAFDGNRSDRVPFRTYVCDGCGHTEMFK